MAAFPKVANGVSFDCSKATHEVEILVCQNPQSLGAQ